MVLNIVGSNQACHWQNIISICYMPCLNPSVFFPSSPVKVPGLEPLPQALSRAGGGLCSTSTANLATIIKFLGCIGQGTRQWQPSPALALGLWSLTQNATRKVTGHCAMAAAAGAPAGLPSSLAAPWPGPRLPSRGSGTEMSHGYIAIAVIL